MQVAFIIKPTKKRNFTIKTSHDAEIHLVIPEGSKYKIHFDKYAAKG
jgi:hypothetical protein